MGQTSGKTSTRPAFILQQPNRAMLLSEDKYGGSRGKAMHPQGQFMTMFEDGDVVRDGPEVRNFSEQTLQWIVGSTASHMKTHGDCYGFGLNDIRLLSGDPNSNTNTLITNTSQHTSQWLILRMLSHHHFVHCFTDSADFDSLKNLFQIPKAIEPAMSSDGMLTLQDRSSNIRIEQAQVPELGSEWMHTRGYNEYFDAIFDESAADTVLSNGSVQTTIYGHCLRAGGVLCVSGERISRDFSGSKLRSKMSGLYPNSHFELIAERDTAWNTQFVFLKALGCSEENVDRAPDREDRWGDGHRDFVQSAIWDQTEGTEWVGDAFGKDSEYLAVVDALRGPAELPYFSSLK